MRLSDQANGYVIADAIRIERVDALPPRPEVQVLDGATDLADGLRPVAFGTTAGGHAGDRRPSPSATPAPPT